MKNIKGILLSIIFNIGFTTMANAQYTDFGIGLGTTTYWGDLNKPGFFDNYFGNSGIGIQAHYRVMSGNRLGIRGAFIYGGFKGKDAGSSQDWQNLRNLSFRSYLAELSVMGELYILPFNTEPGSFFIAPYLTAGISTFWFDPKTRFENIDVRLQPLGTEGQGMPGRPEKYSLNSFAIPFGGGLKWTINPSFNIGMELVVRRSFTDYIDDLSTTYVTYDDLSAANGTLAAKLANRMNEYLGQSDPVILPTGTQRGGADVTDYYIVAMITANWTITDSNGKRRLGGNKITCPTFK